MIGWQYCLRRLGLSIILFLVLSFATTALFLIVPEADKVLAHPALIATGPIEKILNSSAPVTPNISLTTVATGFIQPTDIGHASDDRLFVTERAGYIRIILADGTKIPTPFLDISGRVDSSTDPNFGLLGLTFDPNYDQTGYFYVNYTDNNTDTVIARFKVSSDTNVADASSEEIVLRIDQPYPDHNGGDLNFGPDGYLYIGMGDGGRPGTGADPDNRAQNPAELLGKMLRIDVDNVLTYTIPSDNPFVGDPSTLDEIWAVGLRNPWRFSFDRLTGDMYVADVGHSVWEEIDFQLSTSSGGENYGWRLMEGSDCFNPPSNCDPGGLLTLPVAEYDHSLGCSVTGGYVYRGDRYPFLVGHYLFADFCSGRIWSLFPDGGGWKMVELADFSGNYSTFGEGADGELYLAHYSRNGTVYHIQDNNPYLTLGKQAPGKATAGMPLTYTLVVTNMGNISATHLIITDTIPSGANYISGGTKVGNVVSWTVPMLGISMTTQVSFVVSATQTITNREYGVRAAGGHRVMGDTAITTIIGHDPNGQHTFLPILLRE